MSKRNIRSVLLIAGVIMGLGTAAYADESFCASQLELANTYLGPIPSVGYQMVTLKLGEAQCFFHRGEIKVGSGVAPTPDTIFELASMTKVFTTAILGLRAVKGFDVTSPVMPHLPPGFRLDQKEEKVTFQQLATFTGGFNWSDPPCCKTANKNPVPSYSQEQFVDAVNHLKPTNGPGSTDLPTWMKYSNGSVGFLGQILMWMDGYFFFNPIEGLVLNFPLWMSENLTAPLGMDKTAVAPQGTWATGYKLLSNGSCTSSTPPASCYQQQAPFPWEPWGAAGGLRSNANDMLKFLKANICAHHQSDPSCAGLPKNILDALLLAHSPNSYTPPGSPIILTGGKSAPPNSNEQAWAWVYKPTPASNPSAKPIISKNGGHPGFSSFIGFNPEKKYGLVILMNTRQKPLTEAGIDIIQHTP